MNDAGEKSTSDFLEEIDGVACALSNVMEFAGDTFLIQRGIEAQFGNARRIIGNYVSKVKDVAFFVLEGRELKRLDRPKSDEETKRHIKALKVIARKMIRLWSSSVSNDNYQEGDANESKNKNTKDKGDKARDESASSDEMTQNNSLNEEILNQSVLESPLADRGRTFHIIPCRLVSIQSGGFLVIKLEEGRDLPELTMALLTTTLRQLLSIYAHMILKRRLKVAGVMSAIGSIMARNGSHNIGSHVLSSISHNSMTMPEDRKLFRYIQHRMDYIATATTVVPTWRQPMLLVGSVVSNFLAQTHLLNYISRSEGLSAFIRKREVPTANALRFHVRRMVDKSFAEVDHVFVDGGVTNYRPEKDVAVAVTGGVVGQHAFFTILENIIRNAAKHEWSKRENKEGQNLDIYIDFAVEDSEDEVKFEVWCDRPSDPKGVQGIVNDLNKKIKKSMIDEGSHTLRAEDWGIAEMRISAGFLSNSPKTQIAGVNSDGLTPNDVIRAAVIINDQDVDCVGYAFSIPKPKEVLIGIDLPKGFPRDKLNKQLIRYGIEIFSTEDIRCAKGLAYSYAVTDLGGVDLPMRTITTKELEESGFDKLAEELECLAEGDIEGFANKLIKAIHKAWIKKLMGSCGLGSTKDITISIYVQPDSQESRKGLTTEDDIKAFVMKESFDTALRICLDEMANDIEKTDALATAALCFILLQSKSGYEKIEIAKWVADAENWLDSRSKIDVFAKDPGTDNVILPAAIRSRLRKSSPKDYKSLLESADKSNIAATINRIVNAFIAQAKALFAGDSLPMFAASGSLPQTGNKFRCEGLPINVKLSRDVGADSYCYWRHAEEPIDKPLRYRYLEPLSGSQRYIGHLEHLVANLSDNLPTWNGLTRLAECAMLDILLIDERVAKFAKDHPEVAAIYRQVGISVGDESGDYETNPENRKILIIHQGIIDKKSIALRDLMGLYKYIIVTTGRGIPANIPSNIRVLPFSTIESALFQRYPEKWMLIDAILNLLPIQRN